MMRNEYDREHCKSVDAYRDFYENQAEAPHLSMIRKGTRMLPITWAVKELMVWRGPPCKVLDVGCQHGAVELALATLWYNVTAIDVSQRYVTASKRNTAVVDAHVNYEVIPVEDVASLGETFDVAICLSLFEHVADFDKALSAVLSVLRPPALLLAIVPFEESWLSEEHTRVFSEGNIHDYFPDSAETGGIRFSNNPKEEGWITVKYEYGG